MGEHPQFSELILVGAFRCNMIQNPENFPSLKSGSSPNNFLVHLKYKRTLYLRFKIVLNWFLIRIQRIPKLLGLLDTDPDPSNNKQKLKKP
jgi:hypothetical protein